MNQSSQDRIWGYLDGLLAPAEQVQFEDWLRESSNHREEFARVALLHDRLRCLLGDASAAAKGPSVNGPSVWEAPRPERLDPQTALGRLWAWTAALTVLAATLLVGLSLWQGIGARELLASNSDLQRVNNWSRRLESRSFRIHVLADRPESDREQRARARDQSKLLAPPAKPPLDRALLHARGDDQFVLEREVPEEGVFLTGSDGMTGWAVSPQGAVRTSRDPNRFNRDVPGHEHQLPLNSLFANLDRVESAYRIQLFPGADAEDSSAQRPTSLLVAQKKRGQRGPERIEVTYESNSGRILGMRIIEMPYGPRRLDLELKLEAEGTLAPEFFQYESHHHRQLPIITED